MSIGTDRYRETWRRWLSAEQGALEFAHGLGHGAFLEFVERSVPLLSHRDQAGLSQQFEVAAGRGLTDPQLLGQVSDRHGELRQAADEDEQLQARRITEGLEAPCQRQELLLLLLEETLAVHAVAEVVDIADVEVEASQ